MTPQTEAPRWLADVLARLAAGQLAEAEDAARQFLAAPPPAGEPIEYLAARRAASELLGAPESQPEARESVHTIAELTMLLLAARSGGLLEAGHPLCDTTVAGFEHVGQRVATAAAGYGFGQVIRGDTWFDGYGLTRLAITLAGLFRELGQVRHEARVSLLRARLTTHVLPHYDYEVIPAMNAAADAMIRLGSPDGPRYYEAVLTDYATLPDEQDGPVLDPNVRFALESLAETVRAYPSAVPYDRFDCPAILARITEVLNRPVPQGSDTEKAEAE